MCHILIIEDEWLIADYLMDLAERAGATSVAIAGTEDDAVQAAHDHMPDIILSDVTLTEGTGPHAVRTITTDLGAIPVIFITATPDACAPRDPPDIVLSKPVDPSRLMRTIRELARADDALRFEEI